jgi:penicillin-binding protein 1A
VSRSRSNRVRRRRQQRRLRTRILFGALLLLPALAVAAVAGVVGVAAMEYERFRTSCDLADHSPRPIGRSTFVYAADDSFLGTIPSTVNRQLVTPEQISPWAKRATVAIEDRRFYLHRGVDYRGIARAAVENVRQGEIVEGASTLTQQLVRNLYLTRERTLERKKQEACLALELERGWSKRRILTTYLNRVYYGNRAYGIEAAARTYFSRGAWALEPEQAALLAGLVRAPAIYDPFLRPRTALARRNTVLDAMMETGALSLERAEELKAKPLGLQRGRLYDTRREPLFFDVVQRELERVYGEERARGGGLRVYTTIEPRWQAHARAVARQTLGRPDDPAVAVVSVDPRNGAVRAMVAHAPGRGLQFNLAVQGRRQAGSAFKTFVLAEAIRRGANPYATYYNSAPFSYVPGPGQEPWEPKTYSGETYGRSNLVQATLRSDNLVYGKLTLDLGPESVARTARELGVQAPLDPVASIGLGANEVSVLGMASAYATLAAGGVRREPFAIRKVLLPGGKKDEASFVRAEPERVLPSGVARHVTDILIQNVERGTGTAAQLGRPVAGKTGTTDRHTDAWFVGYVPQVSTAVWVGYPGKTTRMLDVRGIRVTGGSFPAQIWSGYMSKVLARAPVAEWPPQLEPVEWVPWRGDRRYNPGTAEPAAEPESVEEDELR